MNSVVVEEEYNNNDTSTSSIIEIPEEFVCPITMSLMEHPYMSRWGQNYEGSAIIDWLDRGNTTCPLTRQSMSLRDLLRNRHLEQQIITWKQKNGYYNQDMGEGSSTDDHENNYAFLLQSPSHMGKESSEDDNNNNDNPDAVSNEHAIPERSTLVLRARRRADRVRQMLRRQRERLLMIDNRSGGDVETSS